MRRRGPARTGGRAWFGWLALVVLTAPALGACAGSDGDADEVRQPCDLALADLAELPADVDAADQLEALQPTLRSCMSVDEWAAAAERNDVDLGDLSPEPLLRLACRVDAGTQDLPICAELGEG